MTRSKGGAALGLLLVGLAPLIVGAQTRALYLVLPAIAAIASAWVGGEIGRWALVSGGAVLAWMGGAGVDGPVWLPVGLTVVAMLAALLEAPRVTRLLLVGVVATALLLVTRVLARSGWTNELALAERLVVAWMSAFTVGFGLIAVEQHSARKLAAGVVGVCACVAAGRMALVARTPLFPWWERAPVEVSHPAELERLQNAGFRDAAFARTALAAREDADLAFLADTCRSGYRDHVLDASWAGVVGLGTMICRELGAWPEVAAARLADDAMSLPAQDRGVVERVRGEILMKAGAISEAMRAFENARQAGVRLAASTATRALLDRGRLGEARSYVASLPADDAAHGRFALWAGEGEVSWSAWNAMLDFSGWSSPSHKGIRVRGNGRLLQMVIPGTDATGLAAVSDDIAQFRLELPVPVDATMPEALVIDARPNPSFRVEVVSDAGEIVSFNCGLGQPAGIPGVDLGPDCVNRREHTIDVGAHIGGKLHALTMVGGYFLRDIRARGVQ